MVRDARAVLVRQPAPRLPPDARRLEHGTPPAPVFFIAQGGSTSPAASARNPAVMPLAIPMLAHDQAERRSEMPVDAHAGQVERRGDRDGEPAASVVHDGRVYAECPDDYLTDTCTRCTRLFEKPCSFHGCSIG